MEYTRVLRSSRKEARELEAQNRQQELEEKKKPLPYIDYKGPIKYYTSFIDCAVVCDELLKLVNECKDETLVVGFDLEWPFSFQTGSGKASVIQISPSLDICYVLQVSKLNKLPKGLNEFLAHPKTRITGVNIKNDIRKLARDYPGFDAEKIIENTIDSGVYANKILPTTRRWSMLALCEYLLKMTISKDRKVRMSQWHVIPLSQEQLKYAATDAYASLLLYQELKKKENERGDENRDTINFLHSL